MVHVLVCDVQVLPDGTDGDWYAVTVAPFAIVWPLREQEESCGVGVGVGVGAVGVSDVLSPASFSCRTFSCARRESRSEEPEGGVCPEPACGRFVELVEEVVALARAALVRGPTAPYPVVAGVPEDTMLLLV